MSEKNYTKRSLNVIKNETTSLKRHIIGIKRAICCRLHKCSSTMATNFSRMVLAPQHSKISSGSSQSCATECLVHNKTGIYMASLDVRKNTSASMKVRQ